MTAEQTEVGSSHLPFLLSMEDLARILRVSKPTISRMVAADTLPVPACRLSERVVRFKRLDVEAYFGAPLSVLAPWLIDSKETA